MLRACHFSFEQETESVGTRLYELSSMAQTSFREEGRGVILLQLGPGPPRESYVSAHALGEALAREPGIMPSALELVERYDPELEFILLEISLRDREEPILRLLELL